MSSADNPGIQRTSASQFRLTCLELQSKIEETIVGQSDVIHQTLVALLAGGHVLLEGVPGLGKTMLVRTLATVLQLSFNRIQFTPDLMPADCTGTTIVSEDDTGRRTLRFQPGPLFANLILADEINRATPKTQSALLEAMQEHTISVGDTTHSLPEPYFVLATQNPLEMEGTYPLPEAQLDRFFFKIVVPFPSNEALRGIVQRTLEARNTLSAFLSAAELIALRDTARTVPVPANVVDHAIALVIATHAEMKQAGTTVRKYVRAGVSPRALQTLITGAQVRALLEGRYNVSTEDIRALALPTMRHRLLLNFEAIADGVTSDDVIARVLSETGA